MNAVFANDQFAGNHLLSEANHRIANHLAIIASTIHDEIRRIGRGPDLLRRDTATKSLHEAAGRIVAVAHLHRRLAKLDSSGAIDIASLLIESVNEIVDALSLSERVYVRQNLHADCLVSAEQASALVLILSEIVTNAIKYAHPTEVPVQIDIHCIRGIDGRVLLEISDDGVGFPEGFNETADAGLGLKLIRALAKRIGAGLTITSCELGLTYLLELPVASHGRVAAD